MQPIEELSDLRSCTAPIEVKAEPSTNPNLESKDPSRQSILSEIKLKMDEDSLEVKRSGKSEVKPTSKKTYIVPALGIKPQKIRIKKIYDPPAI